MLNRIGERTRCATQQTLHSSISLWLKKIPIIRGHKKPPLQTAGATTKNKSLFYGFCKPRQNTPTNGYDIPYVVTDGTVYAFVVYDPVKADKFLNDYPPDQSINPQTGQPYPPELPRPISDDYLDARNAFRNRSGYTRAHADALGMAYVLEKKNSGVAILRQNADGTFGILRVQPSTAPSSPYQFDAVNCN